MPCWLIQPALLETPGLFAPRSAKLDPRRVRHPYNLVAEDLTLGAHQHLDGSFSPLSEPSQHQLQSLHLHGPPGVDEPLQHVLCQRVRRVKGPPSGLPVADVAARHGDDGLPVRLRTGDVCVVLVGEDVEVEGLQLVVLGLDGFVGPAGERAGVDVGLVEGLEDHALGEVGHGVGLLRASVARRLRGAVDVFQQRFGLWSGLHTLRLVRLGILQSRTRLRQESCASGRRLGRNNPRVSKERLRREATRQWPAHLARIAVGCSSTR
ncbi:hypothetical protein TCAP_04307, partial [Tolypocladium capitatum]